MNDPGNRRAAAAFKDTLSSIAERPRVLIIRMRYVSALDSTGMHALSELVHRSRAEGTRVYLAEVHMQPLVALTGSAALDEIGREHLFDSLEQALEAAKTTPAR